MSTPLQLEFQKADKAYGKWLAIAVICYVVSIVGGLTSLALHNDLGFAIGGVCAAVSSVVPLKPKRRFEKAYKAAMAELEAEELRLNAELEELKKTIPSSK